MARHNHDRHSGRRADQLRCAIYTRKSTEEGLDLAFNSLHAQREACEAFILSQRSEGWTLVPEAHDDGGVSGGTLERPALQRLLGDIRAGRVDIVVVYKVDRLSRSLADFAKLVETFDTHDASFVSVTQAFNTSTSMGRLTLKMLLSFAQFEREVTAERIRDKIAASKRRGLWMGGPVPLGYDAVDRRLVVNSAEAASVRRIYELYITVGTIRRLQVALAHAGIVSKVRTTRAGNPIGGCPLTRGALAFILRKRGVEIRLVLGDVETTNPDPALVRLVAEARQWMHRLHAGDVTSIRALARDLGLDHRHVTRALPLAFLAPGIVTAIGEGRQPIDLTARKLERIGDLPVRWEDQRIAIGMALGA